MTDQGQAYWAAIAQIVPVVALALVLEARVIARRLGRRSAFPRNRSIRVLYAVTFAAVAIGLVVVELLALRLLWLGKSSEVGEVFATYVVSLALSYVALSPVVVLSAALMSDVFSALPWSMDSRLMRKARKLEAANTAREREQRALRLAAWSELTPLMIESTRLGAVADRTTGPGSRTAREAADRVDSKVAEIRAQLTEMRIDADAEIEGNRNDLEQIRAQLLDVERNRYLLTTVTKN